MDKKEVEKIVEEKIHDFKIFMDMFMDMPILAADINHDAKEIVNALKKSDVQLELVKTKQLKIERALAEMERINKKLKSKGFFK